MNIVSSAFDMRDVHKNLFGDAAHKGRGLENLREYISPLIKVLSNNQFKFIGTGFFVANFGVFATAKHVIEDTFNSKGTPEIPLVITHFLNSHEFMLRTVTKAAYTKRGDVALCLLETASHQRLF